MKINYVLCLLLSTSVYAQTTFTSSITADLSAYGETVSYPGIGEYQVFLDTNDGVLDKPIFLIDGFDPADTRPIGQLYNALNYDNGNENLGDFVRSQGFDVVILNFPVYTRPEDGAIIDGGADFIERNSMLLVELLDIINTQKVGDEENVIIGPSMGGLISRYALNYMENQSLDHETRLWLSFDSPHHGANVPIGLQHQLNYLAYGLDLGALGNFNVVELQPLIDSFLKSSAARQLLTDHLDAHLITGSVADFDPTKLLPEAHPFRNTFTTNLNALTVSGFPENTRNISMINGSGVGNPYFAIGNTGPTVTAGYNALDLSLIDIVPSVNADFEVNLTPASASGTQLISNVTLTAIIIGFPVEIVNASANAQAFSYSDGIDAAPGGLFDLAAITAGLPLDGIPGQFVDALLIDKFNFIPAVSAMALEITNDEINWFHDFDLGDGTPPGGDTTNNTPFINWYIPENNEPHTQLTPENVAFALTEIIPETLSVITNDVDGITLERTLVQSKFTLLNSGSPVNVNLTLVDLSGKIIFSLSNLNLLHKIDIPIEVSKGLYILNISSSKGLSKSLKVIAN